MSNYNDPSGTNDSAYELSEDLHVTPMWRQKSKMFEGFKTGLLGAACGAIILAVVGFTVGGWVTGDVSRERAEAAAQARAYDVMTEVCLGQSAADPRRRLVLMDMHGVKSYARPAMVMKAGWATMPGSKEPSRYVARLCADRINSEIEQAGGG